MESGTKPVDQLGRYMFAKLPCTNGHLLQQSQFSNANSTCFVVNVGSKIQCSSCFGHTGILKDRFSFRF